MPTLTKRFIDSLEGDGQLRIIPDDDLPGFALQVTPSGAVSFCIDYRVDGKRKRRVIGRHGPLTVDQARRLALAQLGQAASGKDPLPAQSVTTVAELFEVWMARHVTVHLKPATVANYRIIFDTHCRIRFGALPPHKLTFSAIAEALVAMKATPVAANHMIRRMRSLLQWAETNRLVVFTNGNPARGHRLYRERPVERILSVPEIRTFIARLPEAAMDDATRTCLMLELLTGQRSGEIAGIRRAHVDLTSAIWTIPGELNKPGHTHIVPLPPWARSLIADACSRAKGPYLFPSAHGDPPQTLPTQFERLPQHARLDALNARSTRTARQKHDTRVQPGCSIFAMPRTSPTLFARTISGGRVHPISNSSATAMSFVAPSSITPIRATSRQSTTARLNS